MCIGAIQNFGPYDYKSIWTAPLTAPFPDRKVSFEGPVTAGFRDSSMVYLPAIAPPVRAYVLKRV